MTRIKRPYIILCEGNSEHAYIQELNRCLSENDYDFTLNAKIIGSGHYKSVQRKYYEEYKNNRNLPIKIWVDKDTYVRNDKGDGDKYKCKPTKLPDFLFSTMNFEDFLALHTDEDTLENWYQVCSRKNHHNSPLKEEVYLPLLKKHLFPDYKKGSIPFGITVERLEQLFKQNNNSNFLFRCGFADLLETLMRENK